MRTPSSRPRPRRFGAILVLLLFTAAMWLAVGGLAGANTNASTHGSAKLTLKRTDPATVRGTGFTAHKAVRVKLIAAQTLVRHPVTNGQGTFTATFSTAVDRCTGWSVTASQPGRATVVLRNRPLPECAPARTP